MDLENDISSSASSMESAIFPSPRTKHCGFNRCLVINPGCAKKSHAWGRVTAVVSFPFLPVCYPTTVLWPMSIVRKRWPVTKVITIRTSFLDPQWDVHSAYDKINPAVQPMIGRYGATIVSPRKEIRRIVTVSALNVLYI
jgi:hypothetical protein